MILDNIISMMIISTYIYIYMYILFFWGGGDLGGFRSDVNPSTLD